MNLKEALELSIEAEKNAMSYTNLAKEVRTRRPD